MPKLYILFPVKHKHVYLKRILIRYIILLQYYGMGARGYLAGHVLIYINLVASIEAAGHDNRDNPINIIIVFLKRLFFSY